jgi:hypothetical protein
MPDSCQRMLPRKDGKQAEDGTVQQDLSEFEIEPIPEQKTLERSDEHRKRQYS